jgi:hypothetical protein
MGQGRSCGQKGKRVQRTAIFHHYGQKISCRDNLNPVDTTVRIEVNYFVLKKYIIVAV